MPAEPVKIAVLGAGRIGCWAGGLLAARAPVTLIGRPAALARLQQGLRLTDAEGLDLLSPPGSFAVAAGPSGMAGAALVILAMKSGGTAGAARQIAEHARPDAILLSLQNGVSNVALLRDALPGRIVLGGMVPYNVAERGPGHFHRGTGGRIVAEEHPALPRFAPLFAEKLHTTPDIQAVQWGKLLLNLNNAVNALSGQTLAAQLAQRDYRRSWALALAEAGKIVRAAGIPTVDPLSIPLRWMPHLLALPDKLYFRIMARGKTRVDRHARSSMADDLAAGRPTEVGYLQGEIVRLAESIGWRAPVNQRLLELVHAAEQGAGPLPAVQLLATLKAAQSAI